MRRTIDEVRAELETRRVSYENKKRERRQRMLYAVPVFVLALVLCTALLPLDAWLSPLPPPESPYPGDPSSPPLPIEPDEPSSPDDPTEPMDPGALDTTLHGSASYKESADSFEVLLEAADLIIVGTVTDTHRASSITETATVRVEAVWRTPSGGVPREIYLYQMKDSHTVTVGGRYLLFLKVQTEGVLDTYYSIGGGQGSLCYDAESGRVSGYGVIDGEAATNWLEKNDPIDGSLP